MLRGFPPCQARQSPKRAKLDPRPKPFSSQRPLRPAPETGRPAICPRISQSPLTSRCFLFLPDASLLLAGPRVPSRCSRSELTSERTPLLPVRGRSTPQPSRLLQATSGQRPGQPRAGLQASERSGPPPYPGSRVCSTRISSLVPQELQSVPFHSTTSEERGVGRTPSLAQRREVLKLETPVHH